MLRKTRPLRSVEDTREPRLRKESYNFASDIRASEQMLMDTAGLVVSLTARTTAIIMHIM